MGGCEERAVLRIGGGEKRVVVRNGQFSSLPISHYSGQMFIFHIIVFRVSVSGFASCDL